MKNVKLFAFVTLLIICGATVASAQTTAAKPKSPDALVADLYKAHNAKRSPFFQTRSRARIYQYFEKDLADLIWKDAITSKGEVGVIDGDPLYDAQDTEIKNFAIGKPILMDATQRSASRLRILVRRKRSSSRWLTVAPVGGFMISITENTEQ